MYGGIPALSPSFWLKSASDRPLSILPMVRGGRNPQQYHDEEDKPIFVALYYHGGMGCL